MEGDRRQELKVRSGASRRPGGDRASLAWGRLWPIFVKRKLRFAGCLLLGLLTTLALAELPEESWTSEARISINAHLGDLLALRERLIPGGRQGGETSAVHADLQMRALRSQDYRLDVIREVLQHGELSPGGEVNAVSRSASRGSLGSSAVSLLRGVISREDRSAPNANSESAGPMRYLRLLDEGLDVHVVPGSSTIVLRFTHSDPVLVERVLAAAVVVYERWLDRLFDLSSIRACVHREYRTADEKRLGILAELDELEQTHGVADVAAARRATESELALLTRARRKGDAAIMQANMRLGLLEKALQTVPASIRVPGEQKQNPVFHELTIKRDDVRLRILQRETKPGPAEHDALKERLASLDSKLTRTPKSVQMPDTTQPNPAHQMLAHKLEAARAEAATEQAARVELDARNEALKRELERLKQLVGPFAELRGRLDPAERLAKRMLSAVETCDRAAAAVAAEPALRREPIEGPTPVVIVQTGRRQLTFVIGGFLSIMATLGLLIFSTFVDQSIHGRKELRRATGCAALAAFPELKGEVDLCRVELQDQLDHLLKCLHLDQAWAGDASQKEILLASSVPGEGVSTVVSALARRLATMGAQQVLIVECDGEAPPDVQERNGDRPAGPVVRAFARPGVDIVTMPAMGANRDGTNAASLRNVMMDRLGRHYDVVIYDAGALLARPQVLGLLGEGVTALLVTRAEGVGAPIVRDVATLLRGARAVLGGVVLNRLKGRVPRQPGART